MRKVVLAIFSCAGFAAVILGWTYAAHQESYILNERASAEGAGVRQSLEGLAALEKLGTGGVTVGLSRSFFEKLSGAIAGRSATARSESLADDVRITVLSASFTPQAGRLTANLDVRARTIGSGAEVGFHVDGFVTFMGVTSLENEDANAEPVFSADFRFVPVNLVPSLKYGYLNLTGRRLAGEMVAAGVLQTFFDKLTWSAPYHPRLAFPELKSTSVVQHFGDGGSGTLVVTAVPPAIGFQRWIDVMAPIFTTQGVVLAARLSERRPLPVKAVEGTKIAMSAPDLETNRRAVEAKIAALGNPFEKDVAITLGIGALTSFSIPLAAELNGKVVGARGKSITGRLFDKKWRGNILGDGGFFAEVKDATRIEGQMTFSGAALSMDPAVGPRLALSAAMSVKAPIHVHVDPLIGGGVGTVVGLTGSGSATIDAWLGADEITFDGRKAAMIGLVVNCTVAHVTAKTDGKLRIGSGWATVPAIGAKMDLLVGDRPIEPVVLFGEPLTFPLVRPSPEVRGSRSVRFMEGLLATVSLSSFAAAATKNSYRMSFSFDLAVDHAVPAQTDPEILSRLKATAIERWESTHPPSCPAVGGIRIEVGDVEIGPNNEILKFLRNSWDDISKGPGKNNEIRKLMERIGAAAGGYDDATRQLANDVGDLARRAFPTDSAVGHAAGEAAKSATKAVTNPIGAVRDLGHQILHGFH